MSFISFSDYLLILFGLNRIFCKVDMLLKQRLALVKQSFRRKVVSLFAVSQRAGNLSGVGIFCKAEKCVALAGLKG